ncbi:MAG: hypothetical protein HYY92_02385 [Parcubacteria group bacterium]|nr:hypothetical protein [Parcubacteria group bacterium]
MFNFREKRIFERIIYSKAMLGALSILFFFSLSAVWGVYEKYHEAKQNKNIMKRNRIKTRLLGNLNQ